MKNIHTDLNHQPAELIYGTNDPNEAMAQLFDEFELHEARAALFDFYSSWVNDNTEAANGEHHAEMLRFYTSLIHLMNGAYVHVHQGNGA